MSVDPIWVNIFVRTVFRQFEHSVAYSSVKQYGRQYRYANIRYSIRALLALLHCAYIYSLASIMYSVKIQYPLDKTQEYKESITYAASIELFLHNIHTTQPSASVLTLESSRDLTFALLLLSGFSNYPVVVLD